MATGSRHHSLARRVFLAAGLYGLAVIAPQFFVVPPDLAHPELYYGFLGAVLAWQIAFLVIAGDPSRYRPLMLVGVVEKGVFAAAVPILLVEHRVPSYLLVFAAIDALLGLMFVIAYRGTTPEPRASTPGSTRRYVIEQVETDRLIVDLGEALERSGDTTRRHV